MRITPEADRRFIDALFAQYQRIKVKHAEHIPFSPDMRWLDQLLCDEESYVRRQLYERGYDPDEC
ncbi:hypothetical protein H6A12_09620 [Phocea massiliensis]|uniref:Uncharacterized protein n=1 Tax=Merdimmobilis hominis TaxID=2897707 RepID=A0A938X7L7_9FIRM|nr:hypothetical protein [Merdimmobilis hominis]MBM6921413.1 hypothetical protein [Merdimmobilis hominis]